VGQDEDVPRFSPAHPTGADLSTEVVEYGPGIPTEAELRLLGDVAGKRVLNLGCGAGSAAIALARQGAKVVADDASPTQVAAARTAADAAEVKLELHHAPLAELAFVRADTIDIVLSVYGFGAIEDVDRVFRQVDRCLKPEHPMVFSVSHPVSDIVDLDDRARVHRAYDAPDPIRWMHGEQHVVEHPRTIGSLFTSLGRANFRVDTILEPVPPGHLVPPTLIVRARKQGI
jgi:2-polyprenyl-3-methyl-5-hydroxy-6-metoxy-1,4-benzoquinol methylase